MLRSVCASAIADGVISCIVCDASTGETRTGIDRGGLEGARVLFDILLETAPVAGVELDASVSAAREALIVGAQHATFACVTVSHNWLVLIVTSSSFSVALGWSLLRRIAAAAEVSS